ncbi:hypothetical protein EMCRGX_G031492 [Ephydatia muelleri]
METEERHQTLVIKAANGKFEDFKIDSLRSWNIKHLKTHISHQHPSRPAVSCQKLICAGKLLTDEQLIREISPESGDSPLVLHLVMYERSLSAPAAVTKQVQPPVVPLHEDQVEEAQEQNGRVEGGQEPLPPQRENPAVSQWPRYRGTHAQWMPGVVPLPGYPLAQGYMPQYNPLLAAQMAQWYQSYHGRQLPMEAENGEGVNEGDQDEQILPDQPDGPEAEENAVVMNAGMGGMDAANIQRRRSLGRFLIFAGGILFMLLNQAGWFSIQRRRQDRIAPAPPAPHVPQVQAPPTQAAPPSSTAAPQQPSPSSDTSAQDDSTSLSPPGQQQQEQTGAEGTTNPAPVQVTPPQPGLLTIIFVFFTSFFASLIPQHHQPVPVN